MADLHFYFDPVCPFAWMTSKWVRIVQRQRSYAVEWRFISLRMVNSGVDYAAHFPPEYEESHTAGLKLLRVAARIRSSEGADAVGGFYEVLGQETFERDPVPGGSAAAAYRGIEGLAAEVLARNGLPTEYGSALDDASWDTVIRAETDEALGLTGKDVGTPILHFAPPEGKALFGPVISRLPGEAEALELWEHVVALARFPGFAELKRSLREQPQLPAFGVPAGEVGVQEDWHGGSRRLKK
ncbi:DsbA family protein [Kibdelosporangium philippinense]|uniref:DsbA family protein n=1 Tax=Kibdelosporangium philippinense TaxID=211113 RepID=A0ABS8ZE11_9PSEU|nr:DsbA family protein [Kibdelosporangium philippinense]MCE7004743.1 DsbA family protein [Kibdelosporangium philippinense]